MEEEEEKEKEKQNMLGRNPLIQRLSMQKDNAFIAIITVKLSSLFI